MTPDEATKCVGQIVRIKPHDRDPHWSKGKLCRLVHDGAIVKLAHNLERKIPLSHLKAWKSAHAITGRAVSVFVPPDPIVLPTPTVPDQPQEIPMANVPVPTQPVDVDIAPIIAEFSAANKELRESELFVTEAQLAATRAKERFTIAKAALREALKT